MKLTSIGISGGMCVALALFASACSDSNSNDQEKNAQTASSRSICESQDGAQLRIATAFPLTGDDVANGAAATAGLQLAVKDVSAAGGVLGQAPAISTVADGGDSEELEPSTQAAEQIVKDRSAVVIGPLTAIPALNMGDTLARGCVTGLALSDLSDAPGLHRANLFQLSATDTALGHVVADRLAADHRSKVAFLTFDDTFEMGVRDAAVAGIRADGGKVVYGGRSGEVASALEESDFPEAAKDAVAAGADAFVVLAYGETSGALANLISAGADPSQIYLAGANVVGYGDELSPKALKGATGIAYGAEPDQAFTARLSALPEGKVDPVIAAQTYDATVLAALAAQQAKSTHGDDIAQHLPAVSGADGGDTCSSYEDCSRLIETGKPIHYTGVSGADPFDDQNNAASQDFGVYQYNEANNPQRVATLKGDDQ